MYIYIYIYIHTCMHTYIHTYMYTCDIHMCTYLEARNMSRQKGNSLNSTSPEDLWLYGLRSYDYYYYSYYCCYYYYDRYYYYYYYFIG